MKIKEENENRTVVTSNCGLWCAVVQKEDFRKWQVTFSHDGEWHHFKKCSHYAKIGAVLLAKEFIKKNEKIS